MEKKKKIESYKNDFNRKAYKRYGLMIKKDLTDVIDKLDNVPSKNAYILALIQEDLKKDKNF